MTASHRTRDPHAARPPYLAGDRVQILYMSERGTILADAVVTARCSLAPTDATGSMPSSPTRARASTWCPPTASPRRSHIPART